MADDKSLIDQIVNGVLKQLGTTEAAPARSTASNATERTIVEFAEAVITADMLYEQAGPARTVAIPKKSIVTPAAWDAIKELGLVVERSAPIKQGHAQASGAASKTLADRQPLLVVVRHTDAVDRLWQDLQASWRRELLGCPDDAAKLAISALSRGETTTVAIVAEQSHRAACLANRHESVKAAAVRDAADIKVIRRQLRTNVWCIDPSGKSWFELRNLFRAVG